MLPQTQTLCFNLLPPSILPTTHFSKPSLSLYKPIITTHFRPFNKTPSNKYLIQPLKCVVSVVSDPTHISLTQTDKPFPAEVSRTIMELSSVGTLCALNRDGSPLGIGVRFAVDHQGTPILCLNDSNRTLFNDKRCSLHVQLKQSGLRTPQCTIQGNLEKPDDEIILKNLQSVWKKRFGEEINKDLIHVITVEQVLQIEDFAEDSERVTSSDYKLANPDPLREFAEKIVDEINLHNMEDVIRFCNIYVDLNIQVSNARMVWIDRLGLDMRITSLQNEVFEVRIPFPREVTDEKGVKSSFNCMSQLAWEVEKNYHALEFEKVKQLKKITST